MHNYHKRGQHPITGRIKGLDYGLAFQIFTLNVTFLVTFSSSTRQEGHQEARNEIRSLSLAKRQKKFEPATLYFNLNIFTHYIIIPNSFRKSY